MMKLQHVWVIDDDPINNIVFKKLSTITNFSEEVIDFVSAVDAIDHLHQLVEREEKLPEVIFLDINMPIVSGWDFIDRVTNKSPSVLQTITLYMLTSSSNQSDIHRAGHHPCIDDYIVKPLTVEKLVKIKEFHQQQETEQSTL